MKPPVFRPRLTTGATEHSEALRKRRVGIDPTDPYMTTREAAWKLGIKPSQLSDLENGRVEVESWDALMSALCSGTHGQHIKDIDGRTCCAYCRAPMWLDVLEPKP